MKTPRYLEREYSIREVAAMQSTSYWTVRAVLLRLNTELQGTLLVNRGGDGRGARWRVTLAALKRVCPDWFEDTRDLRARVDELRDELRDVKGRQIISATHIGQLRNKVAAVLRPTGGAHVAV